MGQISLHGRPRCFHPDFHKLTEQKARAEAGVKPAAGGGVLGRERPQKKKQLVTMSSNQTVNSQSQSEWSAHKGIHHGNGQLGNQRLLLLASSITRFQVRLETSSCDLDFLQHLKQRRHDALVGV